MNKRFEMRRSIGIPIDLITSLWDMPVQLNAADISPRGAYIVSELLLSPGEHLVCSFSLGQNRREYCFFGEVTRVNTLRRRTDFGKPGFGICFIDTTPIERLCIRNALRGVPPPIPRPRRDDLLHVSHKSPILPIGSVRS